MFYNMDGLDIVGFDNVAREQMMLEQEAKLEDDRRRNEEDFWNQFPEERLDFASLTIIAILLFSFFVIHFVYYQSFLNIYFQEGNHHAQFICQTTYSICHTIM